MIIIVTTTIIIIMIIIMIPALLSAMNGQKVKTLRTFAKL